MRKKMISGILALAMVFTNVPTTVTALGTGEKYENRQNISSSFFGRLGNLFGNNDSNEDTETSTDTKSSLFDDGTSSDSTSSSSNSLFGNGSSSNSTNSSNNSLFGDGSSSNSTNSNSNSLFGDGSSSNTTSSNSNGLFGDGTSSDSTSSNTNGLFGDGSSSNTSSSNSNGLFGDGSSSDSTSSNSDGLLADDTSLTSSNSSGLFSVEEDEEDVATIEATIKGQVSNVVSTITVIIDDVGTFDGVDVSGTGNFELTTDLVIDETYTITVKADGNLYGVFYYIQIAEKNGLWYGCETVNFNSFESVLSSLTLKEQEDKTTFEATETTTVEGIVVTVENDSSNAIEGATITLVDTDEDYVTIVVENSDGKFEVTEENEEVTTTTEKDGKFTFDAVLDTDKTYVATIKADGYEDGTYYYVYPTIANPDMSLFGDSTETIGWIWTADVDDVAEIEGSELTLVTETIADTECKIDGYVVDESEFGIDGLIVSITYEDGTDAGIASTTTATVDDKVGYYSFIVPVGKEYTITVSGDKYVETTYTTNVIDVEQTIAAIKVEYQTYSVTTYQLDDATQQLQPTKQGGYKEGSTVTANLTTATQNFLTDEGYKFVGWQIEDSNKVIITSNITINNNTIDLLSFIMPEYDVVVRPLVEDADGFNVYFNTNNGTTVNTASVPSGSKLNENSYTTTRSGYTFTGWYKNALLTTAWNFDTDVVTSDTTLYAGWIGNEINLVIDYDGSTSNSGQLNSTGLNSGIVRVGDQFTLNAGTKSGYGFSHWTWYADFGSPSSLMSSNASPTSIIIPELITGDTLYIFANWESLGAIITITNIVDSEDNGDSCYVAIHNSTYGTAYGEYLTRTSTSSESYYFDLSDYGAGMYTIEVYSTGGQETTGIIYVNENNTVNTQTIELLPVDKVASVTNSASNVSNVGSNNLNDQFTSAELNSDNYVTIDMVVSNVSSTSNEANYILESINDNQTIGLFLDVALNKNDGGTKYSMQPVASKGLNVTVQLPDSFADQKSYFVSTVHDNMYTQLNSSNVSYDSDTNSISFYTTQLSVFGIGYTGSYTGSAGGSTVSTFIPTADGYYVPMFQNVMVGQWIEGLGKYELIHPDPTNWKFAGWYFAETGAALTQQQLDNYFIVTEDMLQYGIYPRFVQVDEDGNPLTTPVPSTGNSVPKNSDFELVNLF